MADTETNSGRTLSEGRGQARRLEFFDAAEMPEIPVEGVENISEFPDEIRDGVDIAGFFGDRIAYQPLVVRPDDNGLSMIAYRFAPNTLLPRHWHDTPQIILVLEGELHLGNRVLGPGAGYFTEPEQVYSSKAGPEGCRIVEFRDATQFRTVFVENNPQRWETEPGVLAAPS